MKEMLIKKSFLPASISQPPGGGGDRRKRRRGAGPGLTRGRRGRRAGCSGPRRWCRGRTAAQAPAEAGRYRRKSRRISRPQRGRQGTLGGGIPHQHHGPARKRLLHREAGVAEGPERQRGPGHEQGSGDCLPAAPPQQPQHALHGQIHAPRRRGAAAPAKGADRR